MTIYGAEPESLAEGFIEHPQSGQFRRIESVIRVVLRCGRQRYIARPTQNPHAGGTTSAISQMTASIIPDMPPWILDQDAAWTKDPATRAVRTPPTIPDATATARRISVLSFFS